MERFEIDRIEFVAKITISEANGCHVEDVVYYRRGLSFDMVVRWQWYFQYLAARVKVDNPRRVVRCFIGRTDMLTTEEYIEWKRANLIKAQKAKITRLKNNLPQWDLFGYNRTEWLESVEKAERRLADLQAGETDFYVMPEYANRLKKWLKYQSPNR